MTPPGMTARRIALVGVLALLSLLALAVVGTARAGSTAIIDRLNQVRAFPVRLWRARLDVDTRPLEGVALSQVGYGPFMTKRFTSPRRFTSFSVVDERGTVVFRGHGPIRQVETHLLGDLQTVWVGDFSSLAVPGRFRLSTDAGDSSYPFDIAVTAFDPVIRAVQRAFYFQRAFTAIEAQHAEGPWTHGDDRDSAPTGVSRGWHDAGDFSLYNLSAASAVFWLLQAYSDFQPMADDTNIPESGNGVPDLLDEVRWELEWLLSVQDVSGGFRNSTCLEHYGPYGTNLPQRVPRYVAGDVGTMATARAVGVLAFAATVFDPHDAAFAARSLEAARRGWLYLEARPGEHSDGPTCPAYRQDGDSTFGRHVRMFAAAGLLLATGDARFRDAFDAHYVDLVNDPSAYRPNVYAALMYLRAPAGDPHRKDAIRRQLRAQADTVKLDAATHPFEWAGRYHWGSIGAGFERGGGFSGGACLADPRAASADCDRVAANMHYALGRNSLQLSYINGLPGVTKSRTHAFHHWLAALGATPFAFPGTVGAGPNEVPEPLDRSVPHARPLPMWGYWDDPAMPRDKVTPIDARFTDNDSFSTNEIDIAWQAVALYNAYCVQWLAQQSSVGRGHVANALTGTPASPASRWSKPTSVAEPTAGRKNEEIRVSD